MWQYLRVMCAHLKDIHTIAIWKRKVLRTIFGGRLEDEIWKLRVNKEKRVHWNKRNIII